MLPKYIFLSVEEVFSPFSLAHELQIYVLVTVNIVFPSLKLCFIFMSIETIKYYMNMTLNVLIPLYTLISKFLNKAKYGPIIF